ncbi:MAG: hypothetical protein AABZ30_05605 [Myxococcota bacterium]
MKTAWLAAFVLVGCGIDRHPDGDDRDDEGEGEGVGEGEGEGEGESEGEGEGEGESEGEGEGESEGEGEAEGEGVDDCPEVADCVSCSSSEPTCQCAFSSDDVVANFGADDESDPPTEPADYACLGADLVDAVPAGAVTVTGAVVDFQSDNPIEGALVEVFDNSAALAAGTPLASVESDGDGNYAVTIPKGTLGDSLVWWRTSADAQTTTIQSRRIAAATYAEDRVSVSEVTMATLAAILGTSFPSDTAAVIGHIVDCGGRLVANAGARAFDDAGDELPVEIYYFEQAFPERRSLQTATSPDGLFMVVNIPLGVVDLRTYGRLGGVLTTLGRIRVTADSDAVFIVDIEPLRTGCPSL